MKKLFLSSILVLSFANAANLALDVGVGTGYIDDKKQDVIVKLEKNIKYFNFGAKLAKNYIKTFISSNQIPLNQHFYFISKIGVENFKIENKNEFQPFLKYRFLIGISHSINPKVFIQIGTKAVNGGVGVFMNASNRLTLEYEISKRWLFKRVNDTKSTTSTAIYIDYSF